MQLKIFVVVVVELQIKNHIKAASANKAKMAPQMMAPNTALDMPFFWLISKSPLEAPTNHRWVRLTTAASSADCLPACWADRPTLGHMAGDVHSGTLSEIFEEFLGFLDFRGEV
eukprot:CAMPEP_0206603846 /NCGR_PEP_ID=MMETSP0325_2-20121206/48851_1 /ASSEMBLY_ACC=CAM_ASM_000347 /TAXON_ID=2866 /ORGANISM="Crypthecodinium cohnii, Strain Seligo" /LENGTH=113 /DNA_ID=CAMNT_0054117853 /DNA_START=228 /DNA_END=569 /DNA_ORIENTATION=-